MKNKELKLVAHRVSSKDHHNLKKICVNLGVTIQQKVGEIIKEFIDKNK